jgi:hypothetical protein
MQNFSWFRARSCGIVYKFPGHSGEPLFWLNSSSELKIVYTGIPMLVWPSKMDGIMLYSWVVKIHRMVAVVYIYLYIFHLTFCS